MGVPKFYRWVSKAFTSYSKLHILLCQETFGATPILYSNFVFNFLSKSVLLALLHPLMKRQLSERYPKINQIISDLMLMPEFDNLYLDMNGIIHQCVRIRVGYT
jgi:5'-3' exonuclease